MGSIQTSQPMSRSPPTAPAWSNASTMVRDQQPKPVHYTDSEPDLPPPPTHINSSTVNKPNQLVYNACSFASHDVTMIHEEERCGKFLKWCKKIGYYLNHDIVSFFKKVNKF